MTLTANNLNAQNGGGLFGRGATSSDYAASSSEENLLQTCLANSGIDYLGSTSSWLSDVSEVGVFTKAAGVNWPRGENGIPTRWTVEP